MDLPISLGEVLDEPRTARQTLLGDFLFRNSAGGSPKRAAVSC